MSDEKTEGPVMIPAAVGNPIFPDKERLVARVAELEMRLACSERFRTEDAMSHIDNSISTLRGIGLTLGISSTVVTPVGIKGEITKLKAENAELRKALEPFAEFSRAWAAKPINGIDTSCLYAIHGGKGMPFGATISLADFEAAQSALKEQP